MKTALSPNCKARKQKNKLGRGFTLRLSPAQAAAVTERAAAAKMPRASYLRSLVAEAMKVNFGPLPAPLAPGEQTAQVQQLMELLATITSKLTVLASDASIASTSRAVEPVSQNENDEMAKLNEAMAFLYRQARRGETTPDLATARVALLRPVLSDLAKSALSPPERRNLRQILTELTRQMLVVMEPSAPKSSQLADPFCLERSCAYTPVHKTE